MNPPEIPSHPQSPADKSVVRAFSLIEIVLCLGITAFAFVAIMGLLPVGLNNFRGAVDTSTGAQIFQRVMNDAKQTDFNELVPTNGAGFFVLGSRYFDEQGTEKTTATEAIYHVRVRGSRPGQDFTSLPGTGTRYTLGNTTFLTVQVAKNPGNRALGVDANLLWQSGTTNSVPINTYCGIVTRR